MQSLLSSGRSDEQFVICLMTDGEDSYPQEAVEKIKTA
jgi:hypothetical protein